MQAGKILKKMYEIYRSIITKIIFLQRRLLLKKY